MFDHIPDMAAKRAEISPDSVAFHCQKNALDWTFARINQAANALANHLEKLGFRAGDRLGILCLNQAEFFIALFACQKNGCILAPLNWRQPVTELQDTVAFTGLSAVLYDQENQTTAAALAHQINAVEVPMFGDDFTAVLKQDVPPPPATIDANRPWYLLFTSGTTGTPKAVIQTARMAWANAVNISQAIDLVSTDHAVNFLPLFHTAGINLYTLPVFLAGAKSTILPKFEPDQLLGLLKNQNVTQFFGVPAIYQAFSLHPDVDEIDWAALRMGCGGAPLSEPLIQFYAERGGIVCNGFGMTETGPTVFLMDRQNAAHKIGSIGRAQMLTQVRLAGVPDGETGEGELQLKGPAITPGYFENPTASEQAFTQDGWLKTGDVGRRDIDGYYFIVDRIKDMYISGGENVYPAEVERVLATHPDILESAVIGIPDTKWGEVGAAFLMARPGQEIDTGALNAWCRTRLATYKVPTQFNVLDDFPRTAAGKIRKPDLRKLIK